MGNEQAILESKAEEFFIISEETNNNNDDQNNIEHEKIKFNIFINNANDANKYAIKIYLIEYNNKTILLESSQEEKNKIVNFDNFVIDYIFDKKQDILFEIKINDIIYEINKNIGNILLSRKGIFFTKIDQNLNEFLFISTEKLKKGQELLNLNLYFENNSSANFTLPKYKQVITISSDTQKLYKSECMNDEGHFNRVKIPVNLLKPKFEIQILNSHTKTPTKIKTNISEITDIKNFSHNVPVSLKGNKSFILKSKSKLIKNYSFIDFIKNGIQIGLIIGIDYTSSNGNPENEDSLHYINDKNPNDYEKCILSIGNIISNYNIDQLYPVYGFGAQIKNGKYDDVNHCFPINFEENPNIKSINEIIEYYHNSLQNLNFSNPTFFSPIINRVIQDIKKIGTVSKYYILMMLTDGNIDDMGDTIDSLVEASLLPLSLIIIGIGNSSFSQMGEITNNKEPLISSGGIKSSRNIVQFISYNDYKNEPEKIAEKILNKIPSQVIKFYDLNQEYPEN